MNELKQRHSISLALLARKGELLQDAVGYVTGNELVAYGLATKRNDGKHTYYTITESGRRIVEGQKQ